MRSLHCRRALASMSGMLEQIEKREGIATPGGLRSGTSLPLALPTLNLILFDAAALAKKAFLHLPGFGLSSAPRAIAGIC